MEMCLKVNRCNTSKTFPRHILLQVPKITCRILKARGKRLITRKVPSVMQNVDFQQNCGPRGWDNISKVLKVSCKPRMLGSAKQYQRIAMKKGKIFKKKLGEFTRKITGRRLILKTRTVTHTLDHGVHRPLEMTAGGTWKGLEPRAREALGCC